MRVLLVCTGNTCRSPMAEALLKRTLRARGRDDIRVESAGLGATNGAPVSFNAGQAMMEMGIEINGRARSIYDAEPEGALILTMTEGQRRYLSDKYPAERIETLMGYAGLSGDISDPFGGTPELYMATALQIAEAVEAAADKLLTEGYS